MSIHFCYSWRSADFRLFYVIAVEVDSISSYYLCFKTNSGFSQLCELNLKIIIQWTHLYNSCDDDF